MLIDKGVRYIGFPLKLQDGREDLSEEEARFIISTIKPKSQPFLITYQKRAKEISEICEYLGVDIVQLHGQIELSEVQNLKKLSPNLQIIKSLIIKGDNLKELERDINLFSQFTDFFVTDTYDPQTGRTGATGKIHSWDISAEAVRLSPVPVILAGGLTPENVREAIVKVKPAGVDSHTGVEDSNGRKDSKPIKKFVSEAQKGFNDLLNEHQN